MECTADEETGERPREAQCPIAPHHKAHAATMRERVDAEWRASSDTATLECRADPAIVDSAIGARDALWQEQVGALLANMDRTVNHLLDRNARMQQIVERVIKRLEEMGDIAKSPQS